MDLIHHNESKIDSSIRDSEININIYSIIRLDRRRFGGGVAIYIKNTISRFERRDLVPDNLEMICVEITRKPSMPISLTTWYQPPNSEVNFFLSAIWKITN